MARTTDTGVAPRGRGAGANGTGNGCGVGAVGSPTLDGRTNAMRGARGGVSTREADRICKFLQDVIVGIQPGGEPARLALRHIEPNSKIGALIGQQDIRGISEEDIRTVAVGVYEKAENDAAGLGRGAQRYVLQAFLDEDMAEEPVRVVFSIGGDTTSSSQRGESYVDSEPPNETGLLQMMMREKSHRDDQISDFIETALLMVTAMREIHRDLTQEVRDLRAERRQDFEALDRARSESWKREREEKEVEAKTMVQRELASGIKLLLPAVARRVGAIDPKQPIPADEAALAAVFSGFTQDRLEKFLSSDLLTDVEKVAVMEYATFNAKQAAAAAGENASGQSLVPGQG